MAEDRSWNTRDLPLFGQFSLRLYREQYHLASAVPPAGELNGLIFSVVVPAAFAAYSFSGWPGTGFSALMVACFGFMSLIHALFAAHASGFGTPARNHPVTYVLALLIGLVVFPLGVWRIVSTVTE